jgi:5-formyltetrahydrofolate cyclo-ligase
VPLPDDPVHDVAARKREARAVARSRRRSLIMPDERQEHRRTRLLLSLPELARVGPGSTVAAYVARGREPETATLRRELRDRGVRVLLPVVLADLDLDWAVDDGAGGDGDLVRGLGPGVPEPPGPRLGPEAIGQADVVVTPALAVDRDGRRLGQGGGSYDRALTRRRPDAFVVALLHDGEIWEDDLPADAHDELVHAAVTPHEVVRCTRDARA